MAGYSEKDIDSTEEIWKPPTESEMKIIQARRDRSDRISKVMGTYLLKGYKMLASECDRCGVSPCLLEDPQIHIHTFLAMSNIDNRAPGQDEQDLLRGLRGGGP